MLPSPFSLSVSPLAEHSHAHRSLPPCLLAAGNNRATRAPSSPYIRLPRRAGAVASFGVIFSAPEREFACARLSVATRRRPAPPHQRLPPPPVPSSVPACSIRGRRPGSDLSPVKQVSRWSSVAFLHCFAAEKTLFNQHLKIGFRALTWFSPISSGDGSFRLLLLSLGGTLLVASHPCSHKMLQSHALGGCGERGGKAVLLRRRKS
jgi:hypothetical protein